MTSENPFRIAVVVVMVLTLAVTAYHRLQAAASGEKISRKDEGYLFATVLRVSGLCLFIATLAYVVSPSTVEWASFPLPVGFRWLGMAQNGWRTCIRFCIVHHTGSLNKGN